MKGFIIGIVIFVSIMVCATISSMLQFAEAAKNVSELEYHVEQYMKDSNQIQELVFHTERK